jgi:hypothetical protein
LHSRKLRCDAAVFGFRYLMQLITCSFFFINATNFSLEANPGL